MKNKIAFSGNVFPFGTHVYREPPQDQEELMHDLPLLKRLGFNMIKIQESWCLDEPREGEVDLSRIERVITRADELGLGVYLGLTMEQAPAWLWRKYPDCCLVDAKGQPHNDPTQYCLPADGKPGPCWDHPGARKAAQKFIATLVTTLGRFENIWTWNTWQEIGFWPNEAGPLGFCYCPHTLGRFREWLREKYTTLDNLNATWRTGYGDWEEVEPPRRSTACPPFIDWRYYIDDVYLVNSLTFKTRAIQENDPKHRPVFSHVDSWTIGSAAQWRWARTGDFFGNSNYPAVWCFSGWDDSAKDKSNLHVSAVQEIWEGIMLRTDASRCANGRDRTFWGAEFQGGPISFELHIGQNPTPEDIQRWIYAGLAAGMNGISFWNHRAESFWRECNGFGLLDARGDTTERIEMAGQIARSIQKDPEIFSLGETPQADVAILVNEDLYHFCQATGQFTDTKAYDHLKHSIRGLYYTLWRKGIQVDFLDAEDVETGLLSNYKAAILPVPLAMDATYFAHLRTFVEAGGLLISEACPGRFDAYGFCPRAQMVDGAEELFGARHQAVRIVREPGQDIHWTPPERSGGEFLPPTILQGTSTLAGTQLRASFYLQTLEPTTATPILLAGDDVAGVENQLGKGRGVLLGTFAGHAALSHRMKNENDDVIPKLLATHGITGDPCGRLLRRRRVLNNQQAWFLINPTSEDVTEQIDLEGFAIARDLLNDKPPTIDNGQITITVPTANITCLVLSKR